MTRIEYYVCPLCGKTTPLKSFNPKKYERTLGFIQIREGGGRGSGFNVIEEHPLNQVTSQYPEVTKKVKERLDDLQDQLTPTPVEKIKDQIITNWELAIYRSIFGETFLSE